MNRRDFTKSLAAAATLPALPVSAATSQPATTSTLRWAAVYLSNLQGKFTPEMVSQITGASPRAAHKITQQLIAENLITPAHAAGRIAAGRAFPLPESKPVAPLSSQTSQPNSSETFKKLAKGLDDLTKDDRQIEDSEEATDEQA